MSKSIFIRCYAIILKVKNLDLLSLHDLVTVIEKQTLSSVFHVGKSLLILKFQGGKRPLIAIESTQASPQIWVVDVDEESLFSDIGEHPLSGKLKGWVCLNVAVDGTKVEFNFISKAKTTKQALVWYGSHHAPHWLLQQDETILMHSLDLHPPFKVRGEQPLAPLTIMRTTLSTLLLPVLMKTYQTLLDQVIAIKLRRKEALDSDHQKHQHHLLAKTIADDILSQQTIDIPYLQSTYKFAFPYHHYTSIGTLTSALFKTYKRAKQGLSHWQTQQDLNQAMYDQLITMREQTLSVSLKHYFSVKQKLETLHLIHTSKDKQSENAAFSPYRLTYKQLHLSFGKNKQQNHHLTFHLAKKNEIFLHIKDYPGSHIILHQSSFDHDALIFAGQLALYLSKQTSADVTYAKVGSLKPGKSIGSVIIKDAKHVKINTNPSIDFAQLLLTTTRY